MGTPGRWVLPAPAGRRARGCRGQRSSAGRVPVPAGWAGGQLPREPFCRGLELFLSRVVRLSASVGAEMTL